MDPCVEHQVSCFAPNERHCSKVTMGSVGCTTACKLHFPQLDAECQPQQIVRVKGACPEAIVSTMLNADTDLRWRQLFIPEVLCLPEQKPDIEQLLDVTVVAECLSQRVIRTPLGGTAAAPTSVTNAEGLKTTGRKLVIEGILRQKVIYTAAVCEQSVHAAHFDVPFSAFIILDVSESLTRKYKIDMCIEDIFVAGCTPRQIFKNITLFIKATPLVCA